MLVTVNNSDYHKKYKERTFAIYPTPFDEYDMQRISYICHYAG